MRKNKIGLLVKIVLSGILFFLPGTGFAQQMIIRQIEVKDTLLSFSGFIHKLGAEVRPAYIFPTSSFLEGYNEKGKYISNSFSTHLRYSFQFQPNTLVDHVYKGAYQGIGLSYYTFNESKSLGDPIAFYLFQGARIAQLSSRLSLNYEWNFGLSLGWKPYSNENHYNIIIGSKANAYLSAGLHLNWMISKYIDLISGVTVTHFSNGNTSFPNAGLNTLDFRVGLAYNFNRENNSLTKQLLDFYTPKFQRHVSYDMVLFGSWRRKGVAYGDKQIASPDKYTVLGFNFSPMYNFGYRFRAGVSLDGVYDGSANVYTHDYIVGTEQEFYTPSFDKQIALGLSGRTEYVMPYFTVGLGFGVNVLHRGGDMKSLYQLLTLKVEVTKNSFLHFGYSLNDFHEPNYLMLGIGYRFNNKSLNFYR